MLERNKMGTLIPTFIPEKNCISKKNSFNKKNCSPCEEIPVHCHTNHFWACFNQCMSQRSRASWTDPQLYTHTWYSLGTAPNKTSVFPPDVCNWRFRMLRGWHRRLIGLGLGWGRSGDGDDEDPAGPRRRQTGCGPMGPMVKRSAGSMVQRSNGGCRLGGQG